jgi:hypothetical protein
VYRSRCLGKGLLYHKDILYGDFALSDDIFEEQLVHFNYLIVNSTDDHLETDPKSGWGCKLINMGLKHSSSEIVGVRVVVL